MIEVKIENIVASIAFAKKLDLDMIAKSIEGTEYEPEQFPGLVYRLSNPKTATLLFRSGKANCTGAKNIEDVRKTVDIIAGELRKLGVDVYDNLKIIIQNMVAVGNLKGEINLTETSMALGMENIEYEPEQFPGMVYRVKEPHVVILIFTTGKIVCTGGRNIEDVSKAVEKLSEELNSLGLIH